MTDAAGSDVFGSVIVGDSILHKETSAASSENAWKSPNGREMYRPSCWRRHRELGCVGGYEHGHRILVGRTLTATWELERVERREFQHDVQKGVQIYGKRPGKNGAYLPGRHLRTCF